MRERALLLSAAALFGCEGPPGPPGPPGAPGSGLDAAADVTADRAADDSVTTADAATDARGEGPSPEDLGRPDPRLVCQSCHPGLDVSSLNLVALHDPASRRYNRNCLHCHQDVLNRATLDPRVTEVHRRMLPYAGTWRGTPRNEDCTFCHAAVDLGGERSAAHLRRQVSTRACTGCHSSGRWDYYLP